MNTSQTTFGGVAADDPVIVYLVWANNDMSSGDWLLKDPWLL